MINIKTINVDEPDFNIGKICPVPGQDFFFVLDVTRLEMLQLSPSYQTSQRLKLSDHADIKQIDTAFCHEKNLIIADSISKKFFKLHLEFNDEKPVSISGSTEYPLKTGSLITAAAVKDNRYLLLDKGHSQVCVYGTDFQEIKTLGSRMGYILDDDEEEKQRLGFEFPEDLAVKADRMMVSDSGNKRLVIMNDQGQLKKILRLPEFPYKILSWENDRVAVSDFDRSVMMVSLKYGFVYQEEIDWPVDFFPAAYHPLQTRVWAGSEKNELVELSFPDTPLESLAESAGNWDVLLKIKVDNKQVAEARKIVETHKELLAGYAKITTDDYFDSQLSYYINETIPAVLVENESLKSEISKLSIEFIKKYKAIPDSDDKEAAHIDKENLRHRLFLKIKAYRGNLKKLADTGEAVENHAPPAALLKKLLEKRVQTVNESISTRLKEIEANLAQFNELDFLTAVVDYWLLCEEEQVVFPGFNLSYEKLFGEKFLLAILKDFYHSIAELFFLRNKIDQYIAFCDREISMYPDKVGIFTQFIGKLLQLRKYDDVLRMLKKFPDPDKEDVNYYYYRVYLDKGDMDRAFYHLKRELDFFPHRVNLIPELIKLNKLGPDDTKRYIDKILEKSGQSIDVYYYAALAWQSMGDSRQAEFYLDKELELFPENKAAVFLKLELFLQHPPSPPDPGYYKKSWEIFKVFTGIDNNNETALRILPFFTALNYLGENDEQIEPLTVWIDKVVLAAYKKEISLYLSFLKYFLAIEVEAEVERYDEEAYLSAYSTGIKAYHYFFAEVKRLEEAGEVEKMFELVEKLLKYNPGDEKIFVFLDHLTEQ